MLRMLLQFIVIACLTWSSLVFSEPSGALPEYQADTSLQLVSKTFSVGKYVATVKAEASVNIDSLISEEMRSTKNIDKFLTGFEKERAARYPDEEIHLTIDNKESDNKKSQKQADMVMPQSVSGNLQNGMYYVFNLSRYYNQGWAVASGYGSNGVITYLNTKAGSVQLYHRTGSGTWYYRGRSSWNAGNIFTASNTGYDGYYGSWARCQATICSFHIITYLLY